MNGSETKTATAIIQANAWPGSASQSTGLSRIPTSIRTRLTTP